MSEHPQGKASSSGSVIMQPWGWGKGGGVRETTHPSSWASSNGFADFCQHGMGRRRRAVKISHPAPLAKSWSQRRGACRIAEAGSFAGDASEMPHAQSGEDDAVFPRRRGPKTSSGAMDRAVLDEQVPPRGWYLLRRASASTDPTGPWTTNTWCAPPRATCTRIKHATARNAK